MEQVEKVTKEVDTIENYDLCSASHLVKRRGVISDVSVNRFSCNKDEVVDVFHKHDGTKLNALTNRGL